jgi:hypothetical protein
MDTKQPHTGRSIIQNITYALITALIFVIAVIIEFAIIDYFSKRAYEPKCAGKTSSYCLGPCAC